MVYERHCEALVQWSLMYHEHKFIICGDYNLPDLQCYKNNHTNYANNTKTEIVIGMIEQSVSKNGKERCALQGNKYTLIVLKIVFVNCYAIFSYYQ